MEHIIPAVRIGCVSIGAVLLLNTVVMTAISNLNTGTWMTAALAVLLLLCGILPRIPHAVALAAVIGTVVLAICLACLFAYGRADTTDGQEDAVIVLGAGIRGETLSGSLKRRLDAALDYHEKHPEVLIVVSGGQGPQEDIPESLAMARYLLENGVIKDCILQENASTSTAENFRFSRALLEERFGDDCRIAYISNDYHIYRAGRLAKSVGFEDCTHVGADTPWYTVIPSGLRECAAIIKAWIM